MIPRLNLTPTVCGLAAIALPASLQAITVDVHTDGKQVRVSPDLYGIFYEEINHAGDGGLYAEMVQNRTFEENQLSAHMRLENGEMVTDNGWRYRWKPDSDLRGWSAVAEEGAEVDLSLDDTHPLNDRTPHALRVDVKRAGGKAGFANEGYWGMSVEKEEGYALSFYARGEQSATVHVALESTDGNQVYAKSTVDIVDGDWRQYDCTLTADGTDPKARLVFTLDQPATLWFDVVSLFPHNTYRGRVPGMRADLMGKLEELQPRFLRFPGGCVAEGCTLDNRIQWKQTIGDVAQRPGHWDLWGYRATDGLGFHEFLQVAEDLGAEAMYVVNVGLSCQGRQPEVAASEDEIREVYLQDTLDALEYAMGPVTSEWGAKRAANGHSKPFHVKYVEVGNENHGDEYQRAYDIFYAGIKKHYPDVITIADTPLPGSQVEMVDEHFYVTPDWFFANANRYDRYDRYGPKIYVGEYAVNRGVGSGNLLGALSEAAFMMGMERNSDLVVMASYAPLFENVNDREWPVNLIRFDSSRVLGRSSFYVQKMFSANLPTVMVPTDVTDLDAVASRPPEGRIGLRTWRSDASYRNIRVTRDGHTLYESDFAASNEEWEPRGRRGAWTLQDNAYRQTDAEATDTLTLTGDEDWSDYTIELQAKRNSGSEAFMIVFRSQGRDHLQWNLGGWGNTRHAIQLVQGGSASIIAETPGSIEAGRWYDVKIVLHGYHVACTLDGKLIHDLDVEPQHPADFFANAGIDEATGELVVKLVNATADTRHVHLNLHGAGNVVPTAQAITVTGKGPEDENTLDEPLRVSPKASTISNAGESFTYPAPPWSAIVLRMKTEE